MQSVSVAHERRGPSGGGEHRGRTEALRRAVVPVEDRKWGNKVTLVSAGSLGALSPPCLRLVVLNTLTLVYVYFIVLVSTTHRCSWCFFSMKKVKMTINCDT